MSVNSTEAARKEGTESIQAKKLSEHIKLTRKPWGQEQSKVQEGKLHRGRPAQGLKPEQAREKRRVLELQGNRCHITARVSPGPETSTARFAAQRQCDKQTMVLQHESGSSNGYNVPKADEILVELHKILVFRDKDPFINAVCTKRRSKPKGTDRKLSREQRRADVKNAYFRKSFMTAGERALDEGKAANSSKQCCAKSNGVKNASETSTGGYNEIHTRASQTEQLETKSIELFNKECSYESEKKQ